MDDIIGWAVIAAWLAAPVAAVWMAFRWVLSTKPVEQKYENTGGGFASGLDAVFSPTAYEAGMERDRQTQRTAPAPAPGDPPWTIGDGHIRIDV